MKKIVLISGLPSLGKTELVKNAKDYGALSINMEAKPTDPFSLETAGIHGEWDRFFAGDEAPFLEALNRKPENLILLEWGFPPEYLAKVERMQAHGIRTWWLDGDHAAARLSHINADKDLGAFDRQMGKITEAWPALSAFYQNRIISRLNADGHFLSDRAVFETVFGKRMYHGSTDELTVVAKDSCIGGSKDYAATYALGKVPSSAGFGKGAGWIYELLVEPGQLYQSGVDQRLSVDLIPIGRISATAHKPKTARELLGD